MTQREQLIEDAAKAAFTVEHPGVEWWGVADVVKRRWIAQQTAALAVFEGAGGFLPVASDVQETAHTDNERGALHAELAAWQRHTGDTALANLLGRAASALTAMTAEKEKWRIRCAEETIAWADEVAANHRTVQGEPSEHFHIWSELPCKAGGCRMEPQGEPSNVSEPGVTDISPAQMSVQGEPTPGKRLDPDFRADLVGYAKARIQDVWADVPEGVDAETLAQNVVAAQEFLWIARGFPVASAQGEPSLRDHVRNLTGASDAELDALGGFTGEPSDAQVLAALNSYEAWTAEDSLDMWGTDQVDRMRAALRAAVAVQGGE